MSVITSALIVVALALWPQVPARDRVTAPAPLPTGTAVVAGVVVTDGESPQPVRQASVSLSTGLVSLPRLTVTDDQGRFVFDGLAAGSYRIVAQKPAWVPVTQGVRSSALQAISGGGFVATAGQGVPVAVGEGESVSGLTLRLQRGGVLSGVVRVPGGGVAAGMSVQVLRTSRIDGVRHAAMSTEPAMTDDQGRYRIYGLAPGEYVIQIKSELMTMQTAELRQVLPSEVRWAEAALAQSTSGSRSAPGISQAQLPQAPVAGPTVAYGTTYFPGTEFLAEAAAITLRAGEERLNLDFEIRRVPTATISGSVTGVDGRPAVSAVVTLALPASGGQEDLFGQIVGAGRAVTRADGSFVMTGVPPGAYTLTVRASPPREGAGRQAPMSQDQQMAAAMAGIATGMGGIAGGAFSLWAQESVEVRGQPVGPVALQLREGLKVTGTVVFEGGSPGGAVRVSLSPVTQDPGTPDLAMIRLNPAVGLMSSEGAFSVTGVMPGVFRFSVLAAGMRLIPTEPGEGWMIKSVRREGREDDLADVGLDLRGGGDVSGVVVTLTDRPSELSGRVLDGAAQPFSAFPLVVFSANREHWTPGTRRVTMAQPATDGRYVIAGLPAGQYYVAVVTELDMRELASATFLESLVASAITVTLADGERKTQDIRLAGG